MVIRKMPRVEEVLLPVLRAELPDVTFTTWVPNVDQRVYPLVNLRRLGGLSKDVDLLDQPVVEITAFTRVDKPTTENLYLDVRQVIWNMVKNQTVVPDVGSLCFFRETFGPTQFDSPFEDSWRIQGLIQLGLRPRKT